MNRVVNGLFAMAKVFGWQFTVALLAVVAVLVWSVWHVHGGLIAIALGLLVIIFIAAHDFAIDDEEPTEVDADYDYMAGTQWTDEERAELARQGHAPHRFNTIQSPSAALGQNHEGREL